MKTLVILAAAALNLAAAVTAQTATTVKFGDLDVASTAGRAVLTQRVGHAAGMVCGVEAGTTDLASHIDARRCRTKAIASAMTAVAAKTAPQYASR